MLRRSYTRKPPVGVAPNLSHPLAKYMSLGVFATEGGGLPRDYGSQRHTLSKKNNPVWGSGPSLEIESNNNWVVDGAPEVVNTGRPFTVAYRVIQYTWTTSYPVILVLNSDTDPFQIGMSTVSPFADFFNGAENWHGVGYDIGGITLGRWYDVVITFDGVAATAASSFKCYVDRIPISQADSDTLGSVANETTLGTDSWAGYFMVGAVSYAVVLDGYEATQGDVNQIFNGDKIWGQFFQRQIWIPMVSGGVEPPVGWQGKMNEISPASINEITDIGAVNEI